MDIRIHQHLLDQVAEQVQKHQEIERIKGDTFNIFRILKLESAENQVHSTFIAELLNPKGSHGQNDVFLKLFTNRFNYKEASFVTEGAKVELEKHIGPRSLDLTTGGRIDIVVTDVQNNQILIENKIYARDQQNQLLRYYNYNQEANLFYLCLFGGEASEFSCGGLSSEHIKVISYEQDIVLWLTDCKKESVDLPVLREGINQYINLIKHLTGLSTNQSMNKQLVTLMTSSAEKFEAAYSISNTLDLACEELAIKLETLIKEIADETGCEYTYLFSFKDKYGGFFFHKPDWQLLSIGFQFQNYDKDLIYGLCRDKECTDANDQLTNDVKRVFEPLRGKNNTWWPYYKSMEAPYSNWSLKMMEPWLGIIDGTIKHVIKSRVEEVLAYSKELSEKF